MSEIIEEIGTKIIELYKQGLSIMEISNVLNLSRVKTYRIAQKIDLKLDGRKYRCNDEVFSNFTPEGCYWAGFIAADGCIYKNCIIISLCDKDVVHLNMFKRFLTFTGPIKTQIKNNKKYCIVSITSKKIIKDLENNFNITPKKTLTLAAPCKIPDELINHYIRGYVDGDGCIFVNQNRFSISLIGTFAVVSWIKDIFRKNLLIKNPSIRRIGKVCQISFDGARQFKKLKTYLYKNSTESSRLHRKYLKANYISKENLLIKKAEQEIIDRYKSGESINTIINTSEYGYFKIYRILTESHIKIKNTNKKEIPKDTQAEIIKLRRNNTTIKTISKITGITHPKISEFLRSI